jgi:hypothetical protein
MQKYMSMCAPKKILNYSSSQQEIWLSNDSYKCQISLGILAATVFTLVNVKYRAILFLETGVFLLNAQSAFSSAKALYLFGGIQTGTSVWKMWKVVGFCQLMPLAVHLVRFICISSGNMMFWAKRICCWIYLYIFNHLPYPASTYKLYEKEENFVQ